MLALVDNEPKILNILDMLKYYLIHQEEVVTRRTKYDLNKAEERAHILEGLMIALDNIDESNLRLSEVPRMCRYAKGKLDGRDLHFQKHRHRQSWICVSVLLQVWKEKNLKQNIKNFMKK